MLEISQIKLSDGSISAGRSEGIFFVSEMNVINFFIMGNKLGKNRLFFDVPNGAGGVNGAGADEVGHFGIPVERSERGTELVVVFEVKFHFNRRVVFDFPDFEGLPRSGQKVRPAVSLKISLR